MLFEEGYAHSSIGTHKSAISAYHNAIEGISVGQHPRVSSLMTRIFNKRPTRIFNKRPPLPRYSFIWDVEKVLIFIRTLPIDDTI